MARRFVVEFTERTHRNITVRADSREEAAAWVEDHWDEACALDRSPLYDSGVDECYEAEPDGSEGP